MSSLDSGQAWQPDEEWNPSSHCCHSRRVGATPSLETRISVPRAARKIDFAERATALMETMEGLPNPQAAGHRQHGNQIEDARRKDFPQGAKSPMQPTTELPLADAGAKAAMKAMASLLPQDFAPCATSRLQTTIVVRTTRADAKPRMETRALLHPPFKIRRATIVVKPINRMRADTRGNE